MRKEIKWEYYEALRKLLKEEIDELQRELEEKEKELRHILNEQTKLRRR